MFVVRCYFNATHFVSFTFPCVLIDHFFPPQSFMKYTASTYLSIVSQFLNLGFS